MGWLLSYNYWYNCLLSLWPINVWRSQDLATNLACSFLIISDITSFLNFVANISDVLDIHVFSFLFLNDKCNFQSTFRTLAFTIPSEKRCRVLLTRISRSHVVVLEAQIAPWVTILHFDGEDFGPVPSQQSPTAWERTEGNSIPVLLSELESG